MTVGAIDRLVHHGTILERTWKLPPKNRRASESKERKEERATTTVDRQLEKLT
jgi:hypothetical protein